MKIFTRFFLVSLLLTLFQSGFSQEKSDANIFGHVECNGEHIPFVTVYLEGTTIGTTTDETGHYLLVNLMPGDYVISAQFLGYKKQSHVITIQSGKTLEVNFELEEEVMSLDDVVITGTKTFKRKTDSPVIVNVIDSKVLDAIQVNTLSEGLNFQPGLRMETDCQTCNYSQLRMNGLGGGYSQILINSRPVFSPLTGLYGLEQIPASMIDQIEVVRGGGSALYGSSAIGGTVNVITRLPERNSYDISFSQALVGGTIGDNMINGNLNALANKRNAGISFFASRRQRGAFDYNGDGYSELPALKNNSFGFTGFFKPSQNQKLEVNFSSLYEYRFGGEIIDRPAHEANQAEERVHNVIMGGIDYEIDFNDNHTSFIFYAAGQNTQREHYTGIIPDDSLGFLDHFLNPPYGNTLNNTIQAGTQLNHRVGSFFGGVNILTIGAEYLYDDVFDQIQSYNYILDQTASSGGLFIQSDWEVLENLTLLTGLRMDLHNYVDHLIFNPRVSLLYKYKDYTQVRASWASGFRAPQAFDADMHIAFAGGGISRIILADDLMEERSNSFSGSVNFDKPTETYIFGFTLEGFYTRLQDAFVLEESAEDAYGLIFEKRNSGGSTVQGLTFELRGNYNRIIQLETGLTAQTSRYDEVVTYAEGLDPMRDYLRTPNLYGYSILTYTPTGRITTALSGVYTGPMTILHLAGAPELPDSDVYYTSKSFYDLGIKFSYLMQVSRMDSEIEWFGGVKNILNAYQNDFDTGKYRDSGYVYGPATPRTYYLGLRLRSL